MCRNFPFTSDDNKTKKKTAMKNILFTTHRKCEARAGKEVTIAKYYHNSIDYRTINKKVGYAFLFLMNEKSLATCSINKLMTKTKIIGPF